MPRRNSKRYPVQRNYNLTQALPAPSTTALVDVPKHLSQINHRLYRQARYYEVSVTVETDMADTTTMDVYALADTWMVQKSVQMAKDVFDRSTAEAKESLGEPHIARWNDLRIRAGLNLVSGPDAMMFNQTTLADTVFTAGEFEDTRVIDQTGASRYFTWSNTPTASEYNIMGEYDASSNTSADPETPATGAYDGLMPNTTAAAVSTLQNAGNEPPYNATSLGAGIWSKIGTLTIRAGRQKTSTGFFTAPCGLVALDGAFIIADELKDVRIEVKSGDYKGVKAPSMLE